jgi:hypothetical protein
MPKSAKWSFFNMPLYERLLLALVPPLVFSHANADDFLGAFDECMGEMGG